MAQGVKESEIKEAKRNSETDIRISGTLRCVSACRRNVLARLFSAFAKPTFDATLWLLSEICLADKRELLRGHVISVWVSDCLIRECAILRDRARVLSPDVSHVRETLCLRYSSRAGLFAKTEDSRPRAMVRRLGFEWHARSISALVVGGQEAGYA